MSFLVRGLGSFLRPFRPVAQPFVQPLQSFFQPTAKSCVQPTAMGLRPLQCLNIVRGFANHRHKKMIRLAKGYKGRANRCFTVALQRVMKARQYAYRDRKVKKRDFRQMWIQRINASARMYGMPYSKFVHSLNRSNIILNRKVLSELAVSEPLSFKSVLAVARESIITV